ncbi:MAG: N-acetyl-gamma-glutamyl-phosphate reductase [Spirochaetales bacterium]|nr:N-acetyl-gamma-glutamyl-phosphate reductase [Spirochaetales bacterium]
MKPKIFIDGQAGTTGLMIHERLDHRDDIQILTIPEEKRKDREEKKRYINEADIVFLCLPDQAARESAALVENDKTRVIDASTAHRTNPDWAYGFAELAPSFREKIKTAQFTANPGCHATGFIAGLYPLVQNGLVPAEANLTCQSLSGYSGAGKKLIAKYDDPAGDRDFKEGPHHYALNLNHKHLPEMAGLTGLTHPPLFTPMVGPFYKGMVVTTPLFFSELNGVKSAADLHSCLADHYAGEPFIRVMPLGDQSDFIDGTFFHPQGCNDTNRLDLFVYGNETQAVVLSRLDNLGKGASGAAVQNMNIMLGFPEDRGLKA